MSVVELEHPQALTEWLHCC